MPPTADTQPDCISKLSTISPLPKRFPHCKITPCARRTRPQKARRTERGRRGMSENIRSPLAGRGVARRSLLKSGAVLAGAIAAPAIVSRSALSSSGEVNYMGWAGYDFTKEFEAFTKKTGIKVNFNEQPDQ